ncbi:MAG: ABC transporter ATP-binding protein [Tetrasphaera sp.]
MTHPAKLSAAATPMGAGLAVRTHHLDQRYGKTAALTDVNLDLAAGRIHGLLGRNGAGKTTLLAVLASQMPATLGEVEVGGRSPFEDETMMAQTCLIRESGNVVGDESIAWNLDFHALARPTFDPVWAQDLLDAFGLNPKAKPDKLSRGQRSCVGAVIGLASRAPVTMFDEVHIGMDAPTRQRFTDLLIADFAEHPRTVILSSHLIQEIEYLLETVTILHRGQVVLSADADEVHRQGLTVTGPAARVDHFTAGMPILTTRDLGPTRQVTVYGQVDPAAVAAAESAGLTISAPGLQDLFIHLTEDAR